MSRVGDRLPVTVLLSQALIAFTVEFDNEWERRVNYSTTDFGGRGVWAVSQRQWLNFMQYVPREGVSVPELTRVARAQPGLHGMQRWGYVTVDDDRIVLPKRGGLAAKAAWRGLAREIEERWEQRLGRSLVAGVREVLEPVAVSLRGGLPDWITHFYGGYATEPVAEAALDRPLSLSAVLSLPLHAITLAYERESTASLSYTVNVLRLLDSPSCADGVAVASLPERSGVALVALRTAIGVLEKRGFVERAGRVARLTDLGAAAVAELPGISDAVEQRFEWAGPAREALESLLTDDAPLWPRIEPPPESWRVHVPRPVVLPWHPIPRQGGHPDGV